jgi:hypothetical protein
VSGKLSRQAPFSIIVFLTFLCFFETHSYGLAEKWTHFAGFFIENIMFKRAILNFEKWHLEN